MFCSCYQATNIYLPISWSLTPFVSFVRAPLPNLGFSLAGFTTFHSFVSKSIVTAARYGINHIKDLDYLPPLAIATLGYFFPKHEHYNHHRLCEHLSLYEKQPCLDWARLLSMAGSIWWGRKQKLASK